MDLAIEQSLSRHVARSPLCATGALRELRQRGVKALAILGWFTLLAIVTIQFLLRHSVGPVLVVGVAVNLGPTLMALRRRHDVEARSIAGTLAATMPALLVYALQGHQWQMDAHMYFFVALATLTVLCDWRPIALSSVIIAVHHLILEWLAPEWVFTGEGNIARVLFHAVAVILQFAVLAYITSRLAKLLQGQDEAVVSSARLVAKAEEEKRRADEALIVARKAEADAEEARRQERENKQQHAAERRQELVTIASDFEQSIASIAIAIEAATTQLGTAAADLDDASEAASLEARDVAVHAVDASSEIHSVADKIADLGISIRSIASAAEEQREITMLGQDKTERSRCTIEALAGHAEQISEFVGQIRSIAVKTNLLSLNARIEASRAGEAGSGFAVVANEIKGLAADTSRASDRIIDILSDVHGSVKKSIVDAGTVSESVSEVLRTAIFIAAKVANQRVLADGIEDSAMRTAKNAGLIEQRIAALATNVTAAVALSSEVRSSTSALSANARDLRLAADRFIGHLLNDPGAGAVH